MHKQIYYEPKRLQITNRSAATFSNKVLIFVL